MIQRQVEIVNRLGLHARAAAKLVHLAGRYSSRISIEHNGEQVDAKSILGILLLAAAQGTTVQLRCEGKDEGEACEAIAGLIANRFDEGE